MVSPCDNGSMPHSIILPRLCSFAGAVSLARSPLAIRHGCCRPYRFRVATTYCRSIVFFGVVPSLPFVGYLGPTVMKNKSGGTTLPAGPPSRVAFRFALYAVGADCAFVEFI